MKSLKTVVSILGCLVLSACDHSDNKVKITHFQDGRYAYQAAPGEWWWFYSAPDNISEPLKYFTGSISDIEDSMAIIGKEPTPVEIKAAKIEEISLEDFLEAEGEPITPSTEAITGTLGDTTR